MSSVVAFGEKPQHSNHRVCHKFHYTCLFKWNKTTQVAHCRHDFPDIEPAQAQAPNVYQLPTMNNFDVRFS